MEWYEQIKLKRTHFIGFSLRVPNLTNTFKKTEKLLKYSQKTRGIWRGIILEIINNIYL